LKIDLENQLVANENGNVFNFEFDPYWKKMLLNGWDEISVTLHHEDKINEYELERIVN